MDATEIIGIKQCIEAGLRFAWIEEQVSVTGPREVMNRAANWLREHREVLRQTMLNDPAQFAEAEWLASDAQAAMWAAFRLQPSMSAYNLLFGLRAAESLDL